MKDLETVQGERTGGRIVNPIVGIDPGVKGGVVVLDPFTGKIHRGFKTKLRKGKIDWTAMLELFHFIAGADEGCEAALERQSAFTMKDKKGNARVMGGTNTMLENYGRYKMLLELAGIPYVEIYPQSWQAAFRPRGPKKKESPSADDTVTRNRANKAQMMQIAKSLWPETAAKLGDAMQDGFWEAALIAEFRLQQIKNEEVSNVQT